MDSDQIEAKYDILSAKASGAPDEPWTECVALDDVLEIAREAEQRGIDRAVEVELKNPSAEFMLGASNEFCNGFTCALTAFKDAIRNLEVPNG